MAPASALLSLLLLASLAIPLSGSAAVAPISDLHRSAALDLFAAKEGSFGSLEETYQALRTFQILKNGGHIDLHQSTCPIVVETIGSSSSTLKDLFNALKVNGFLGCKVDAKHLQAVASRLKQGASNADSLWDMYNSIGGLLLLKEQGSDVVLNDVDGKFHAIKALSQSDGRWRYNTNSPEANAHAAGIALEALAGVLSLSNNEVDQSMVGVVKNDIVKLFDSAKSYDDGALYFDDEHADADKYQGPILTTTSVVRGLALFSSVATGKIHVEGDKILGLAKFFLTIGVPGSRSDFFYQVESLFCLENNRIYVPLILSHPGTVLSLSSNDLLKVKVTTVLGSAAPSLTVNLKQALTYDSKRNLVLENQELKYDADTSSHILDILSLGIDVGKYLFDFEITLHDPDHKNIYTTGRRTQSLVFVTGLINIKDTEISVRDADSGSADTKRSLDLAGANTLALSANHLQKLKLSFQLTTPQGNSFRPHQIFLKLVHESKVEHIFMMGGSEKFSIELVFLGLVDKLYYLSGRYELQLSIGDSVMENSFSRILGYLELDLPEPPERAPRPPPQPVDPYLRFSPKAEISHIFNTPEKRPREELSIAFLVLTLAPLLVFLVGLTRLGVNVKNFPTATVPAAFSFLFHAGIAAVLSLYMLFWLKLDLFITLKVLGILGGFLIFVGHGALSHLASVSSKLKSS